MDKLMSDTMKSAFKSVLVTVILLSSVISLSSWLTSDGTFPIKYVRIEGDLKHVSEESISAATSTLVETGFFALNTKAITKKIEGIEWVESVRVSRVWPDTVSLTITEQQPVAIWNKQYLLNRNGQVFKPKILRISSQLPRLSGKDVNSAQLYESFKRINTSLDQFGVAIISLSETSYGSWSAITSDGIQIEMGKTDPLKKVVTGIQLLTIASMDVLSRIKKIDMRYPNGVSVSWKDGENLKNKHVNNAEMQLLKS